MRRNSLWLVPTFPESSLKDLNQLFVSCVLVHTCISTVHPSWPHAECSFFNSNARKVSFNAILRGSILRSFENGRRAPSRHRFQFPSNVCSGAEMYIDTLHCHLDFNIQLEWSIALLLVFSSLAIHARIMHYIMAKNENQFIVVRHALLSYEQKRLREKQARIFWIKIMWNCFISYAWVFKSPYNRDMLCEWKPLNYHTCLCM